MDSKEQDRCKKNMQCLMGIESHFKLRPINTPFFNLG